MKILKKMGIAGLFCFILGFGILGIACANDDASGNEGLLPPIQEEEDNGGGADNEESPNYQEIFAPVIASLKEFITDAGLMDFEVEEGVVVDATSSIALIKIDVNFVVDEDFFIESVQEFSADGFAISCVSDGEFIILTLTQI